MITRGSGFREFSKGEFKSLDDQLNIMVFVGNGFDLQLLQDYDQKPLSDYVAFYHYLKTQGFDEQNRIFKRLEDELNLHVWGESGHGNWSNIEGAIAFLAQSNPLSADDLLHDLRSIQSEFAKFLELVAPSRLLTQVGADAVRNKSTMTSLSSFLGDIRSLDLLNRMNFHDKAARHHLLYNFLFVNFNFTTLLDNYIYTDPVQLDPLPYKTIDTNFSFREDPRNLSERSGGPDAGQSGYVVADVVHPHGVTSVPRSLLFGVDSSDDYRSRREPGRRLGKPYWAQADPLYANYFKDARLFIIFGCSLGESDGWWWRHIAKALFPQDSHEAPVRVESSCESSDGECDNEYPELIIYVREGGEFKDENQVLEKFLRISELADGLTISQAKERIYVILYNDNERVRAFLNTRPALRFKPTAEITTTLVRNGIDAESAEIWLDRNDTECVRIGSFKEGKSIIAPFTSKKQSLYRLAVHAEGGPGRLEWLKDE